MAEKICDLIPTESSNILIVGCGFSRLTEELADEGFNNITSVDISYNAINLNKEEYKETYPNLQFKQMDVRNMSFNDASFDVVIDKALLDAISCGDGAS